MDRMDSKLDALFAEYRSACPDPEPSADFMPAMWKRIEARRIQTAFAANPGASVLALDGRMLERLHAEDAARILALAKAIRKT